MRILTGKDRKDYEQALFLSGQNAAKVHSLQDHLRFAEKVIETLQGQLEIEKRRADAAVDQIMIQKGVAPITPSLPGKDSPPMFEEDSVELERLRKRIEREGITGVMESLDED